jgi:hypothetical protein
MDRVSEIHTSIDFRRPTPLALLDRAIEVFKEAPGLFLSITALADVPLTLSIAGLIYRVESSGVQAWGEARYVLSILVLSAAVSITLCLNLMSTGALASAALTLLGLHTPARSGELTIRRAWRTASTTAGGLILVGSLRWILMITGILLFFIPTLLGVGLLSTCAPIATVERRGVLAIVRRCIELGRHAWLNSITVSAASLLGWVVLSVNLWALLRIASLLVLALTPWDVTPWLFYPETVVVLAASARVLIAPLAGLGHTLCYVDARVASEGLDLLYRSERRTPQRVQPEAR